jgi:hypothetical protein
LKPTCTSSLINCLDSFGQMLSFNHIVLPIIYQRHASILSKIRQYHSRCSSALTKYSTSKHTIVCFSSNGLLRSIGYNWIACIMGQQWTNLFANPSIHCMTQNSYMSFYHWKRVACMYLDKMPTSQQDTFVLPSSRIYLFLKECFLKGMYMADHFH